MRRTLPVTGDRGAGVPLTRHERSRLDFTRTTVVHARWAKAAAWAHGVRDWVAWYDHTLTVGELEAEYASAGADPADGPTMREAKAAVLGAGAHRV